MMSHMGNVTLRRILFILACVAIITGCVSLDLDAAENTY